MTYIKLLTVLTTLALLTACGGTAETPANNNGGEMPDNDKTDEMPDNDKTGGVNTTDCTQTPFHNDCDAVESAITSRQTTCFTSATANPTCGAVIMGACMANPFRAETACMADTYLPNRIAECITDGNAGEAKCETLLSDTDMNAAITSCLKNPFDVACESVTAFTSFALARTNRASFCDNSDNVADDFCTGDNVTPICEFDKFTAICPDATYGTPRQEECLMDIETNPKCTGEMGIATVFCKANLFDTSNACMHEDYNDDRQTACLMDIETNPACMGEMGIATVFCKANLFDTSNACMADTYLPARIAECIMAGNAGESKCDTVSTDTAMNDAITDCLENPFATACESVSAFTTFALARTNRESFCDMAGNNTNALCMGESLMGVCGSNPFNAICFTDKTYLPMRLADCITTASTELPKCNTLLSDSTMNTPITACLTNPFTDACASNADFMTYAGDARTNREVFCGVSGNADKSFCTALTTCQGNAFDPTCGDYFAPARITDCITVANTEATKCDTIFSDSGMNIAITACLTNPFTPACAASESAFTTYVETARDNRVTFCETMGNESKTPCMGATMAICGFDVLSTLCTDASYLPDRVTACITDGNAGLAKCNNIFTATPATNNCLANPFTDACTADGAFTSYLATARTNRNTFCGTNPSDTVCDTLNLCNGNPFATECEEYFQTARVTLCGGSTVFSTCVNVGDLPTYPTKPNEVTGSGFLTGTATGLNTTDIQFADGLTPTIITSLTIGRRGGAGTTESPNTNPDGFAYFVTNTNNSTGYAGILATTNLGAPLAAQPTAIWAGHFSVTRTNNVAVNYFVDFAKGEFGFSNTAGDGANGTLSGSGLFGTYTMNAYFGNHASANGYSAGRMGGTVSVSDAGIMSSSTIVGLIGAEGAVGVFTRVGNAGGYTGGFTATNPD